jgi:aminobenzoyl-glutamate utilization protein B
MRKLYLLLSFAVAAVAQNQVSAEKAAGMKADLVGQIDAMKKQAQVMVDSVFSFGELGFQEVETSRYLTAILEKEGFKVDRGVAGIPTAFVATWGRESR